MLMLAGSQAAHESAYRLVTPAPGERAQALAASGHGYFAQAPLVFAVLIAVAVAALLQQAAVAWRGGAVGPRLAAGPFALLPPLAFALQEHLERFLHTGHVPYAAGLEPTFLLGIALQLPFALVAFLAARALLGASAAVGRALAHAPRPAGRPLAVFPVPLLRTVPPPPRPLALGVSERGPPTPAAG